MTSISFVFIVTSFAFLGLSVRPEEALGSRYSNMNPALTTVSRYRPAAQGAEERPKQTTITGVVVALNQGIVLTDGPCRQSMVVRVTHRGRGMPKNRYVLVRRDYGCDANPHPIEMFHAKRRWELTLIRDSTCDHTFEEIKDIVSMSPASGPYRIPVMKIVPGNGGEKIPTTRKLACYWLKREVERSVRQERVSGASSRKRARDRSRSDM